MNMQNCYAESGKRNTAPGSGPIFGHLRVRAAGRASRKLGPDPFRPRHGISLIEVLISMFVLLFGLMGAASLFPVGTFYAQKGEQYDLGGGVAQAAFDQIKARGFLRPEGWVYAGMPPNGTVTEDERFMQPSGYFNIGLPVNNKDHHGHVFVIDPMGASFAPVNADIFPYYDADPNLSQSVLANPWLNLPSPKLGILGERWPVRRLTLMSPNPANPPSRMRMPAQVAETIFRLRDDLAVEQPKEDDHPATQRWEVTDPNNTPDNLSDDVPLIRQYLGNYTWIATIVPKTAQALNALQPADAGYGNYECEVSVVVFRKRDIVPSVESERLVDAVMNPGGEIEMFIPGGTEDDLDTAFQDIRSGNWIAVMGVHQVTGVFMLKWYRLLGLDHESEINNLPGPANGQTIRRAMLDGPDWPESSPYDLKVALLPRAIGVVTRPMAMERDSLWGIE